ncbi:MAG: alpha-amylase family glycosyl hydrolase [Rhodopseudomonas palustris]|nr:alpha-amylase family glycosyl hydrolase [Rhodopseudomonas palustris]
MRRLSGCFVHEAHERGLRVITELVINHTSDQHPWFQRARRAPTGSAARDWYVWSDTDQKYRRHADHLHRHREVELDLGPGSRRSTTGTASSRHQPDLNFDNPARA